MREIPAYLRFPLIFKQIIAGSEIAISYFATRGSSVRVRLAPFCKCLYRKDLALPSGGRK